MTDSASANMISAEYDVKACNSALVPDTNIYSEPELAPMSNKNHSQEQLKSPKFSALRAQLSQSTVGHQIP